MDKISTSDPSILGAPPAAWLIDADYDGDTLNVSEAARAWKRLNSELTYRIDLQDAEADCDDLVSGYDNVLKGLLQIIANCRSVTLDEVVEKLSIVMKISEDYALAEPELAVVRSALVDVGVLALKTRMTDCAAN